MIRLDPMTPEEYERYREYSIPGYAEEQVRAGIWPASEAERLATESYARFLPDGLQTKAHHLYVIRANQKPTIVGYLWWGPSPVEPHLAFLLDIVIFEAYRGRGWGEQALALFEKQARAEGYDALGLHVFGHNLSARSLYRKAGYVERNVTMVKKLI